MLEYAEQNLDDSEEVKFVYALMHGSLMLSPENPKALCLISRLSQNLVDKSHSCPVVMRITRIFMTTNVYILFSLHYIAITKSLVGQVFLMVLLVRVNKKV